MKKIIIVFSLLFSISILSFAQLNGSGFYRIRNVNADNEYLSVVYDSINAQKIVGTASSLAEDDGEAAMGRVGTYLDYDIKIITPNDVFTDPGSVLYLEKQSSSNNNFDIIAQGVGLKYISYCVYVGTSAGAYILSGLPATITETSNGSSKYTAKVTLNKSVAGYTINQTRYFGDENSTLSLSKTATDLGCQWYIEPINLENNYFAAAPVEEFLMNNNYYTTLRTAFSYKVPGGSAVKVYKVTDLPAVAGGLATLEEIPQGNVILAGFPVVIESSKHDFSDNMLEPIYNANTAPIVKSVASAKATGGLFGMRQTISSSSIGVTGLADSNVLYNGYGRHGHDGYSESPHTSGYGEGLVPDWLPQGNNIGFFKNKYNYGVRPVIYRFGIKGGAVGFWDQVASDEIISGNEAYSPVQCQLFPAEKDLAYIAENGADGVIYDVTEVEDHYLYGAIVVGNTLYAKDYGRFSKPDEKPNGAIDGMSRYYDYNDSYDQSNWVAITGLADPSDFKERYIHVKKGKLLNRVNPEMKVVDDDIDKKGMSTNWAPNSYCPASFIGTQTGTNGKTYFFVKPKPQEVIHIVGAIYGGDNKFYINNPDTYYNTVYLKGGFMIDPSLLPSDTKFDSGTAYEFDAVVKKAEPSSASLNVLPYIDGGVSDEYVVYPFSTPVVTGVQNLDVDAQIVSVKYYNTIGIESAEPFKGVNIVVTTYDNGTRTTSKVIK
ncbi:MAG: hypothetical protein J6X22_07035 [Muribaculaceae bacterium]|nr:hypothetical protein [Muribaculaceae bacterium]